MKRTCLAHIIFLWILLIAGGWPMVAGAQSAEPCVEYKKILKNLAKAEANAEFGKALQELSALRACAPEQTDEIDAGYERVFAAIARLKDKAEADEALARQALAEAKRQKQAADAARQSAVEQARNVFLDELDRQLAAEIDSLLAMKIAAFAYRYVDSLHPVVRRSVMESYYRFYQDTRTNREQNHTLNWIQESPDGQLTAMANVAGEIIVARNDTSTIVDYRPLIGKGEPLDLAWSADSKGLAVTTTTGYLAYWRLGESELTFELEMEYPILAIDEAPQGHLWAAGSGQGLLYLLNEQGIISRHSGHAYAIAELQFAPDGQRLATVSYDGLAKIWTLEQMDQALTLSGHTDYLRDVSWSPDSRSVLTVGDDEQAMVWNAQTGEIRQPFYAGTGEYLLSAAWHPTQNLIAVGDAAGKVIIWAPNDTTRQYEFQLTESIIGLQWAQNGQLLQILQSNFLGPFYWSLAETRFAEPPRTQLFEFLRLSAQTDQWTVSWRPGTNGLAAGYADGNVWVWTDTEQMPFSLSLTHGNGIWELAYSPDGSILAAVSPSDISFYQADDQYRLRENFGTRASHVCLAWHPNGTEVALGDTEGNVRVYDVAAQKFVSGKDWQLHTDQVRSLDFTPDGQYLLSASEDSTAVVFKYDPGVIEARIKTHTHVIRDAVWSPDGRYFATGGDDRLLCVFALDQLNQPLYKKTRHESRILSLDWAQDGRLASVSDRELFFWNGATGDTLSNVLYEGIDRSDQITFATDGRLALAANSIAPVIVASDGTSARLPGPVNPTDVLRESFAMMSSQTQMSEAEWENLFRGFPPQQVRFSHDGSLIALLRNDGQILIHDGLSGERLTQTDKILQLTDVAWSPTAQKLAVSYKDNTVLLYDFTRRPFTPLQLVGHQDWVRFVDWAPDGQRLVSGADDNQLIIWRATDGRRLHQYSPANQRYLMDGMWLKTNRIAVLDQDGTVFLLKMGEQTALFTKLEENAKTISASPNRDYVLVELEGSPAAMLAFQAQTGANVLLGSSASDPRALTFIPSLESWIISFGDSRFRVQDLDNQVNLIADLGGSRIIGVSPSPTEAYLAITTEEELIIWDWAVEKVIFRFPVSDLSTSDLRWSPNGKRILFKEERGTAQRLLDPDELLRRAEQDLLDVSLQRNKIDEYHLDRLLPPVDAWYALFSKREKGPQMEAWASWLSQQARESIDFRPELFQAAIQFYQSLQDDRPRSFNQVDLLPLYIEYGKRWLQMGQVERARQALREASQLATLEIDLLDLELPLYLQTKQRDKAILAAAKIRTRHPDPDAFIRELRRGVQTDRSLELRTQVFRILNFDRITEEDVKVFNVLPPPHSMTLEQLIATLPEQLQAEYRLILEINRLEEAELDIKTFWQDYLAVWNRIQNEQTTYTGVQALTQAAIRFITQLSGMPPTEALPYQKLLLTKLPPFSSDLVTAIGRVSQQRFREITQRKTTEQALAAGQSFLGYTRLLQGQKEFVEYLARGLAELAWVELKANRLDSAYAHLEEASTINNAYVLTLQRYGHYLLLSGDPERAMAFYQLILSEKPEEYSTILSELDQLPAATVAPTRNILVKAWAVREAQQGLLNRISSIRNVYQNVGIDPKVNYTYLQQMTRAEAAYRDLLAQNEGVPLFLTGADMSDTTMAFNLGNYAYYALFAENFPAAVEAAERSLALHPTNWVYTNYAHAYLYQGEWEQAAALYATTRLLKDDSANDGSLLADALLQDLVDLKAAGIWHKDVPKAAELILGRKLDSAEKKRYGKP